MRKLLLTTIITLLALGVYGQATTNKRIMLDSLNNKVNATDVRGIVNDSLDARIGEGTELSDVAVIIADSTGGAAGNYVTRKALIDSLAASVPTGVVSVADSTGNAAGNYMPRAQSATLVNDSIAARLTAAVDVSTIAVMIADSTGNAAGNYVTRKALVDSLAANVSLGAVSVADSTGNAPGNYVTRKALVDSLATVGGGVAIADVRDEIADSLNVLRPDLRTYDSDTTALFIFGAGAGGLETDTALFTTSNIYGSFFNAGSDTLIVTNLRAVMIAGTTPLGTDTLSIHVYWNDTINVTTGASVVKLNTDPLPINSVTTGTTDTSFNNSAIPPNVWVFCKSPGVVTGRKPKALIVQLTGFKRNRSY